MILKHLELTSIFQKVVLTILERMGRIEGKKGFGILSTHIRRTNRFLSQKVLDRIERECLNKLVPFELRS